MAYQGGYGGGGGGGSQASYAGHTAQQSTARGGYGQEHPSQQYGTGQPYNDYDDGYGYENQAPAYGHNGAQNYQDQYGPGPGRGAGPMPPYARGGDPMLRPGTADGNRGSPYPPRGPGPGRGMPSSGAGSSGQRGGRPGQYPPRDFGGRRPPPSHPDASYGGYEQDGQLAKQMSEMDMNGQRSKGPPEGRSSYETSRSQDNYGRPVNGGGRGYPGYGASQRGPPAGQAGGGGNHAAYNDGYGGGPQSPMGNEFSPPIRSMTLPVNDAGASYNFAPPRRVGTAPFNGPGGPGAAPPRPSTAGGHRPPPQRIYPPSKQRLPQGQYGGGYDERGYSNTSGQSGPGPAATPSSDEVFDSYYDSPRVSGSDQQPNSYAAQPGRPGFPEFDTTPANSGRRSYDHAMRAPMEQPQPGAHGTPRLHHAKSEANFHEPQTAVFEMAGDIPSMPPIPSVKPYQPEFNQGYPGAPASYNQLPPRGPSAPPGPVHDVRFGGSEAGLSMTRHNPAPSIATNPDSLPSHPTPVRPGLMPNSLVNMKDRPPPVRNYGGVMQQQQAQQYGQPQPHQQQHLQQQLPPTRSAYPPVEIGQIEEPVTAQQLERLRMAIKINPNDQESALRLARRLIEAADVLAPKLPDPKQRLKARDRYLVDAHKVLKKLSNAQNQEAMYTLADGLGKGLFGNEPDNKEAFTMYQSAAKLGHASAAYRTAVCCEIGHEDGGGTRKDPLKAMQWYKRAATLGDPPAMYKVGMILLKGLLGQQRNPREAVGWLKRAAERADAENPHALHELGLLYESAQPNDAIIRDERYALELFQQAANLGYKFSQFRLGLAYENGQLGVERDHRQSIYWYSQAAQREEHQSELALSGWYLTGSSDVLNQSDTEAYLWARKAAVSGLPKAEYAMGYFTEVGIGVAANLEDAKRWYWRAAAQDFPKARDRLEELKRVGRSGPARQRERISRSGIERQQQQDGDCIIM
ncbi:hypothetical protein QQS21_010680 [Conoideocrella luteorostrata]|uniref:Chitin synthase activator n=1 Tax=Conoideocrella luteorostrata TaxID=1105319 RepID=A0AAJ0CEK3_9HYPO|nr:hypothetical protein QQS21_010680 [Conoideocrella luteorostrata]